jgi:hypothetical protein
LLWLLVKLLRIFQWWLALFPHPLFPPQPIPVGLIWSSSPVTNQMFQENSQMTNFSFIKVYWHFVFHLKTKHLLSKQLWCDNIVVSLKNKKKIFILNRFCKIYVVKWVYTLCNGTAFLEICPFHLYVEIILISVHTKQLFSKMTVWWLDDSKCGMFIGVQTGEQGEKRLLPPSFSVLMSFFF